MVALLHVNPTATAKERLGIWTAFYIAPLSPSSQSELSFHLPLLGLDHQSYSSFQAFSQLAVQVC